MTLKDPILFYESAESGWNPAVLRLRSGMDHKDYDIEGNMGNQSIQRPRQSRSKPIVLSADALNLVQDGYFGFVDSHPVSMAVNDDASRVYFGLGSRDHQRLNLGVLTLDLSGKPVGKVRYYPDSSIPLPAGGSVVFRILVDSKRCKLYLAASKSFPAVEDTSETLTVYDLDADGEPVGQPRTYDTGNPHKYLYAIALHPTLSLLYLGGRQTNKICVYALDPHGNPLSTPQLYEIGQYDKTELAISPDGRRLYLGSSSDLLEVVDLNESGVPVPQSLQSFDAGRAPGETTRCALNFHYTPQAIYRRHPLYGLCFQPEEVWPLIVWPLDANGHPVGKPQALSQYQQRALAIDPRRNRVWLATDHTFQDAFTQDTVTDGMTCVRITPDASGLPVPGKDVAYPTTYLQEGVLAEAAANGTVVVLTETKPHLTEGKQQVKDFWLELTILDAKPSSASTTFNVLLWVTKPLESGWEYRLKNPDGTYLLRVGKPSEQVLLNDCLRDRKGQVVLIVNVSDDNGTLLDSLQVKIDFWLADGSIRKSLTEKVHGNSMVYLMPGHGFLPPGERLASIELLSQHAQKYLTAAQQIAVPAAERPKQFIVSSGIIGFQGHVEQLKAEARTISMLGINTVAAGHWKGISPSIIDSILDSVGLARRALGNEMPPYYEDPTYKAIPSYFDFVQLSLQNPSLEDWANEQVHTVTGDNGASPADVVDFKLADEPGWWFPQMLKVAGDMAIHPQWLAAFRSFLQGINSDSAYFGFSSWDEVFPMGAGPATAATKTPAEEAQRQLYRHLFYWTIRFFTESAARGFSHARDALVKSFGHSLNTDANWNNWINKWYFAHYLYQNPDQDPANAARGAPDWMASGRSSAHTIWTEDWFGDQDAQKWSCRADALRSASMLDSINIGFGAYVVGQSLGTHPAGASYKILSLIGHGAKSIDIYTFGPEMLFPTNCWSEKTTMYRPLAEALGLVGRAERLLYPGTPSRGKIALLMAGASALWEGDPNEKLYELELPALHYALIHAGYTVDFVDDTDVAQGELSRRGYTTVYVVGPNVSSHAQAQLQSWVQAGGTLAVVLGAGVADEYNTPNAEHIPPVPTLEEVLGVQPRKDARDANDDPKVNGSLILIGGQFGSGCTGLLGPVAALQPNGAAVAGTLSSGGAGITINQFGAGRAIAYAFFPGCQYWYSPNRHDQSRLPLHWDARLRHIAIAPARLALTPPPIDLSHELVEACRLDSSNGIAIVLLNWSDEPIAHLQVIVPNTGLFAKVSSAQGTNVAVNTSSLPSSLVITLAVQNVDVLLIE